jgi:hypothetical protein
MAGMSGEYGMAELEARLRALMRAVQQAPDAVGPLAADLNDTLLRTASALRESLRAETV